ncbi:uncharacterized, partial [Tachysurus ichikawai]
MATTRLHNNELADSLASIAINRLDSTSSSFKAQLSVTRLSVLPPGVL